MSDTIQVVSWALEQDCALRSGEAVYDVSAAGRAVGVARAYGESLARPDPRFGIFGDVYVDGWTEATLPKHLSVGRKSFVERLMEGRKEVPDGPCSEYPISGCIISEQFGKLGGAAGLEALCRDCPANTARPYPAGCVGRVFQIPECAETQELLESIIRRLGLQSEVAETFTPTTPVWFGLWTRSPLTPRAAGLLVTLLTALKGTGGSMETELRRDSQQEDLERFINAARIAASGGPKLHVHMPPPGHVDFGWHTVFPHCPVCKAEADLDRWKGKYPVELHICAICQTLFSPALQASSERYTYSEGPELRDLLGAERFREFARSYLITRGMLEADAAETVELSEAKAAEGRKIAARRAREVRARERYIEESLYSGLRIDSIPDPDYSDRERARGFRAQEFAKLVQRCAERNIKITGMNHLTASEDLQRHLLPLGLSSNEEKFDPFATLAKWRSEGCDELFGAYFNIPEPLIAEFERQQPQPPPAEDSTSIDI